MLNAYNEPMNSHHCPSLGYCIKCEFSLSLLTWCPHGVPWFCFYPFNCHSFTRTFWWNVWLRNGIYIWIFPSIIHSSFLLTYGIFTILLELYIFCPIHLTSFFLLFPFKGLQFRGRQYCLIQIHVLQLLFEVHLGLVLSQYFLLPLEQI